jgi:hypothetical protein
MFMGVVNLLTFEWLFSRMRRGKGRTGDLGRQSRNLESRKPETESARAPLFLFLLSAFPISALPMIRSYPRLSEAIRAYPGNEIFSQPSHRKTKKCWHDSLKPATRQG